MKKKTKKILTAVIFTLLIFAAAAIISLRTSPYDKDYAAESISDSKKQIALTFDDGPGKHTQELLDGLRERDVKVSFFLMGKKIGKYPDLVQQMAADGHLVGTHTYNHINFFKSSMEDIHAELDSTNELIYELTGQYPEFFRPPYGYYLPTQLNRIDQIAILWSDTPRDWVNIDEDYICDYLVQNAKDGQIILLHDTKDATVPAVLRAIDILMDEGYEFVRVDQLLCRNGDMLAPGLAYRSCQFGRRPWYL